jgi:SAM-dependent methyltransferase
MSETPSQHERRNPNPKSPTDPVNSLENVIAESAPKAEQRRRQINSVPSPTRGTYQIMMPNTKQLPYGSKEWADELFASSESDPWGHDWRASQKFRYLAAIELVQKHLEPATVNHVLDIGCALAHFTSMLADYFQPASILGVDISELAVAKCRQRFDHIEFLVASLPDLDLERHRFDFVSALEVIYYVDAQDIDNALMGIREVMAPGAYLLISTYLNKPPFESKDSFKAALSAHFTIQDEKDVHNVLYTQFETLIRQSLAMSQALQATIHQNQYPTVTAFIKSGLILLGDIEIVRKCNERDAQNPDQISASHSIVLARKETP